MPSNKYLSGSPITDADPLQVQARGLSWAYITLAAPTTTVVKATPGVLHSITVNKPAANGVISVYNHASGAVNPMAIITRAAALLSDAPVTLVYDIEFSIGLTIVTSGAAQDITVSYA